MINGVGNASGRAEGIKEGIEIGESRGRQEGLTQGREEGIREIIYSAFQQGLSTEVIASLTHMSIEEIEKLCETVPCRDA
ncbi:MAG: hypothetical protein MST11_05800 [Spirochaetia bacterium]|nr:hypothetical protein [Spirochaetia bacterium]